MLNGTYDDVSGDLPDNYFDLIVCNDVIEHMIDHDDFFEKIKQKMAPNATILMSIPNVRYIRNLLRLLLFKDWQYEDAGVLDRTHLRFFTEKSLRNTLCSHHYEILKFQRINKVKNRYYTIIPEILLRLLGQSDTLYLQFACVVRLNK